MTEQEWLARDTSAGMLTPFGCRLSPRKLRLALCSCLRSPAVWPLLESRSSRRAVEVGEAFADGAAGKHELRSAQRCAYGASRQFPSGKARAAAALATYVCWQDGPLRRHGRHTFVSMAKWAGLAVPVDLVHDVQGHPSRTAPSSAAWLTPTVTALAEAAYEERSLPAGTLDALSLAVLADALEEAGCDDPAVLGHLRGPGPHVRGCHVLDALLGKL
jgi:hypothetical protein